LLRISADRKGNALAIYVHPDTTLVRRQ